MTCFRPEVPSYSYDKKVNQKISKQMYEIFPFLKQTVSVIYFLNLLIVIESLLWNRKER